MSRLKRLVEELHRRSLWQVLAIYAGASWLVFEIVQTLTEGLRLPDWFPALAFVLLLIGLPIVIATAFVQEGGPTLRRQQSPDTEVPGGRRGAAARPAVAGRGGLGRLFTWRNAIAGGVLVFALWGIVAAGWLLLSRDASAPAMVREADAAPAPAIAVLPFNVRGEDLEVWREGMVDLLSTGLDGAGGLRSIDSRTVLARWRDRVPEGEMADRETALSVARAMGARYALIGSAVSVGSHVRFVADIYELPGGEVLGHPQVQGPSAGVLDLVDRLAVESLLLMLERSGAETPNVNLASVTTSSVPALRAWLEGESWYRRVEVNRAIAAYERAVSEDSTFALAYYGLALSFSWVEDLRREPMTDALSSALRWIDRLPAREATLVRAFEARVRDSFEMVEPLRALVRSNPDDPEAWYLLAETYYHEGEGLPVTLEEAEEAFRRAVELDPEFGPYHLHLIDIAFRLNPDSARLRRLIDDFYARLTPETFRRELHGLAFDLAFGDEAHRQRGVEALDTARYAALERLPVNYLMHPRFWREYETVVRVLDRRGPSPAHPVRTWQLFAMAALGRGQVERALGYLDDPSLPPLFRPCVAAFLPAIGIPLPEDRLQAEPPDWSQLEGEVTDRDRFEATWCLGQVAADRESWSDHRRAIERLEAWADSVEVEDARFARELRSGARILDVYGQVRRGPRRSALRALEALEPEDRDMVVRWWLAQLYMEEGRWREAIPYLRSFWWEPVAHADYYLGQAYENLGQRDEARQAYGRFIAAWSDADPELQGFVQSARRALERLTAEQAG